ncbi:hypothetical protein [Mesorhizobium xinjiangense]|uniref:hypothetical protein n=1 Tax=Mesorhizobium xinjiangense TaxID=2678685 RepID=UPI0012ECC86B|nr:hypothetical protein [Mesorhizobium xinjiangense]
MPQDLPHPAAIPKWWTERDINFAELSHATGTAFDTLYTWHRLIRAAGHEFGAKFRGEWHFSARELYAFHIAAALQRLRYPVGHEVLNAIVKFAEAPEPPTEPFIIKGDETGVAAVFVSAHVLFDATVKMMANVREGSHA